MPPMAPDDARLLAGGMVVAGLIGLTLYATMERPFLSMALLGGPCAGLGLGGLLDPRVLWGLGPHRHQVPPRLRWLGAALAALGLVAGVAVLAYREGAWPQGL